MPLLTQATAAAAMSRKPTIKSLIWTNHRQNRSSLLQPTPLPPMRHADSLITTLSEFRSALIIGVDHDAQPQPPTRHDERFAADTAVNIGCDCYCYGRSGFRTYDRTRVTFRWPPHANNSKHEEHILARRIRIRTPFAFRSARDHNPPSQRPTWLPAGYHWLIEQRQIAAALCFCVLRLIHEVHGSSAASVRQAITSLVRQTCSPVPPQ